MSDAQNQTEHVPETYNQDERARKIEQERQLVAMEHKIDELMSESNRGLWSVVNGVGGISGLMSIALVVWNGGTLWANVKDHERRVSAIEQGGSGGLREHVKQDDERVNELRLRVVHQEEISAGLVDLKGDVKVINVKLDALRDKLGEYVGNGKRTQ